MVDENSRSRPVLRGETRLLTGLLGVIWDATMRDVFMRRTTAALGLVLIFSPTLYSQSRSALPREVEPQDCYARVMLIHAELEQIRFEMGRPKTEMCPMRVEDAEPREVLFQARSFLEKANRLSFELTRSRLPVPDIPQREIVPNDVYVVLDVALRVLGGVKAELGLATQSSEPARDPRMTPSDVFGMIFQASRQTDLLIERSFSSSDVYKQVTVALGYAARLRGQFSGPRVMKAPALIRGLQPLDAHRQLLRCVGLARKLSLSSGVDALTLLPCCEKCAQAGATDSYEVASLIVSELAHLYSRVEGAAPPFRAYPPGRKFPSHLHQRAGMLAAQLEQLESLAQGDPDWLGGTRGTR